MKFEKLNFDYILENLDISSKLGKKRVKEIQFTNDSLFLEKEFFNLEVVINLLEKNPKIYSVMKRKLSNLKDISSIVERLINGYVLDDVELFEIKIFSMISQEIYELLKENYKDLAPQNLEKVIDILDPDKIRIASFHIYNSYSIELSQIRDKIKETKDESLYDKEIELEDNVRKFISKKLLNYNQVLKSSIKRLGYLDFVFAKAQIANKLNLVKPIFANKTKIVGMFNPKVLKSLEEKERVYQKVDISLGKRVTVITGANMSGKTLTLKTLGLIQVMAQTGFFVSAESAELQLLDDICLSIGDSQSLEEGLSSFAAEMLEIDGIVKKIKKGVRPLVLIDELARTTNPEEGRALLKSVVKILDRYSIEAIITTHYDDIGKDVTKLRVVGIKKDILLESVDYKNIENYIDYSLVEVDDGDVPEEALTIAKLLKIDDEIIKNAYEYL
ncbi:MAG: MutS-related protein [Cetobacterium sp.]|uniref:lysine 5,6-aminomutase reactivase ATPase KamC n=1 Tax=Cetobacterium sp. TaxID=2071632 RepID=UPI003F2F0343